ncbi:hypothetical protein NMY22_g4777 [Coprinellus aureogranulatus]|nr:hypothetical protein NMY22_g4777 [Coprinellus aureogranulatus]
MLCLDCIPKHFATLANLPGASEKRVSKLLSVWTVPSVRLSVHNPFGDEPAFHIASAKALTEELNAIDTEDKSAIYDLKIRWEEFVNTRMRHMDLCVSFADHQGEVYRTVKEAREIQVIKRMSARGYSEECQSFIADGRNSERRAKRAQFDRTLDKYVHCRETSRDLSDREWEELEAKVVPFMEDERAYQLERKRIVSMAKRIDDSLKPAFLQFVYSQPPNRIFATGAELALMPEWRDALLAKPAEETSSASDIADATAEIPASCEKIRKWKIAQLLQLLRSSKTYEGQEVTEDALYLASTIFRCTSCEECYTCSTALVHPCNYDCTFKTESDIVFESAVVVGPGDPPLTCRRPTEGEGLLVKALADTERGAYKRSGYWNALQNCTFDDAAHSHMVNLLDALGKDRSTLAIDLEKEQPYVEVLCSCYNQATSSDDNGAESKRQAIYWLDAANYSKPHSPEDTRDQWYAKLRDEDSETITKHEFEERARRRERWGILPFPWDLNNERRLDRAYMVSELTEYGLAHPEGVEATKAYVDSIPACATPTPGISQALVALQTCNGHDESPQSPNPATPP